MKHRAPVPATAAFAAACLAFLLVGFAPTQPTQPTQNAVRRSTAHVSSIAASHAAAASLPRSPNVVTVHATDYAFEAPDRIPAGMTTFKLINEGKTFHHVVIVRLNEGKTLADLTAAFKQPGPPPSWAKFLGGPNAPDPGAVANATLDVTPGNYALVCFVDVPGGVPHFVRGMVHALTVTPSTAPPAPAPPTDETITLKDYNFVLSAPLTADTHTIKVINTAAQPHEIEIIKLGPGKTSKDVLDWMQKPEGPPPGHGIGGVSPVGPGTPVYFTADFTPGNYMFVCFVPDAKDGRPHYMHGMVQTLKVS